jgi:uncharacterized membrane protein YidH (DUF202 family)
MKKQEIYEYLLTFVLAVLSVVMLIAGYVIAPSSSAYTASEIKGIKVLGYFFLVIAAVVLATVIYTHFRNKKNPEKEFKYTPEQTLVIKTGYTIAFYVLLAYLAAECIIRSVFKLNWSSYYLSVAFGAMLSFGVWAIYCLLHGAGFPVKSGEEEIQYSTSWFVIAGVDVYFLIDNLRQGYKFIENGQATYLVLYTVSIVFFAVLGFCQFYKGYNDKKKEQENNK